MKNQEIKESRWMPYKVPTPNNMGMVRYILAFAVLISHFNTLTGYEIYFPVSSYEGVGGFFALSGFLIYGSYLRKPGLKPYLVSRAWRILPAYLITVLFFALILGTISSLGPWRYYLSSGFWQYLAANLSFLNFLHPTLPGVFEGTDYYMPAVNGSLWTMKVEWCLYVTPPIVVWLLRRLKGSPVKMFAGIYILASLYRIAFEYMYSRTGAEIYQILGRQFFGQLAYFYTGVLIYYRLPLMERHRWASLSLAIVGLLLAPYLPYGHIWLQPFALSLLVLWLSMTGRWGTWEGKRDNISYNIYLIHFPVIQLFVYFRGATEWPVWGPLILCVGVTWLLSWTLNLAEKGIRRKWKRQYS